MYELIPCWPPDWPEIMSAVQDCVVSGQWGRYHSDVCHDLQQRLCEMAGVSGSAAHCRLCCSGTAAVEIALRASGVGPGDEVIVAALDYPGNYRCIEAVGARPVLVDVQPDSPCIDPESARRVAMDSKENGRIVAMIASSLYGHAADLNLLNQICKDNDWTLINDACQVMGMMIGGKPVESLGDIATASFGGSKIVSAGAGGAIFTNNDRLSSRIDAWIDRPSNAFPLSPLQAAVIGPQLDRVAEMNQNRRETVAFLTDRIDSSKDHSLKPKPSRDDEVQSSYYKLALETRSSDARTQILAKANDMGLPMGTAFRSMDRSSPKRCRKPVELVNSRNISERWIVLDQRALLVQPEQRDELMAAIEEVCS